MVSKIVDIDEAISVSKQLSPTGEKLVLVGGCFDILHIGHIQFLQKAKDGGEILFVMLESDESIKSAKGEHRPLNPQADRATILASLIMVDYVIILPAVMTNQSYDELVIGLKPAIIATTIGDPSRVHKERQANQIGAKVVDVIPAIENQSTSRIVEL